MSVALPTSIRPRILAVADAALVARLRPLVPHAQITRTTVAALDSDVGSLCPKVVLCASVDPGEGLRELQRLRRAHPRQRVLFLTPPQAAAERLAALEAGVDEAIATPIDDAELAGRLSLLIRRAGAMHVTRLPIGGGAELDLQRRELLRDGERIHLRPKEAGLLELLAREPGRTVTRGRILDRVWGPDHHGDPRTIDVHVRWLRAKIEADPRRPQRLITVRGVGYRLEPETLTEC